MNKSPTIPELESLSSDNPKIKYGAAKRFIAIAKSHPQLLSPHLNFFINLLDSRNNILKWSAIDVIGNMFRFGDESTKKLLLKRMVTFLQEGKLITAAHAIAALHTIAQSNPEYRKSIITHLLNIQSYNYETDECKNIIMGKIIIALKSFADELGNNKTVRKFAEQQTNNPRNATKKKAEQFLKLLHRNSENGNSFSFQRHP
ncbi:MAG: hypothetical protein HY960_08205 [Ignavibacteriae bacterium]|nr:hypothetical protein [Ignavibacteriota bacterium]